MIFLFVVTLSLRISEYTFDNNSLDCISQCGMKKLTVLTDHSLTQAKILACVAGP